MASSAKRLLIPQKTSQSLQEINRLRAAAGVRPAGQDWSRYVRMISSLMRKQAMGETPRHKSKPKGGAMTVRRRTVLKGMLASSALVAAPAILRAQSGPMKIGFLTVKTGPLASGGIQMEQGLTLYLKERNNMLAGVQLLTGDSAGAPAMARTKMQEFLERENIACLIGPLATAEALAIDDYIRDKQ